MISPFQPMKLLRHGEKIKLMLAGVTVYPVSVEFDLSNKCPHDCPMCSFGTSKSDGYRQQNWVTFPTKRALELLDEFSELGVQSVTFTGGGEPLIHPDAAVIFERAAKNGLQYGIVTNGVLLTSKVRDVVAESATFVRVSLDAGTEATHQITHGIEAAQFERILGNMQALRLRAPALTIGASFCVQPANVCEVMTAAQRVKDAGGSYLELRPTYPTEWRGDGWNGALTSTELKTAAAQAQAARALYDDDSFQVIGLEDRFQAIDPNEKYEKGYTACHIGPLTTIVGADGRLWHCCVMRGIEGFSYGSVLPNIPFKDVWDTRLHKDTRSDIDVAKCPRCRYDSYNRIIEGAFLRDGLHAAFV
jgi:MoaA/NifB/PqqE/SkfB family radical SAM enzyme